MLAFRGSVSNNLAVKRQDAGQLSASRTSRQQPQRAMLQLSRVTTLRGRMRLAAADVNSAVPAGLVELTSPKMFSETIDHGHGLVFVDYYAEWCGPCRLVDPVYHKLAQRLNKATFTKVNCSNFDKSYLTSLQVKHLPTFQAYRDGQFIEEFVGARPSELASWLERLAKKG